MTPGSRAWVSPSCPQPKELGHVVLRGSSYLPECMLHSSPATPLLTSERGLELVLTVVCICAMFWKAMPSCMNCINSSIVLSSHAPLQVDISGQTRQKVEEDRKHIIEAAIVRIMKARRVLDYNSIVTEVTRQMSGRFVPVATDIKKRIESLIEREFIERDVADRKMYRYLA